MKLIHAQSQQILCTDVQVASNWRSRLVGLIGTKNLKDRGLMIPRCNWIHTFFMSIPIDVVYLDQKGIVRKIDSHLKPWKLAAPVFSARDVVELPAGFSEQKNLKVGDALHVGH